MHNAACPYEALQIATDLATMGTKDGSIQPFGFLTLTPNTGIVGSYWNWAYSLIAGANEMLKYSEINTNWDNSTDKALYQAESRFFPRLCIPYIGLSVWRRSLCRQDSRSVQNRFYPYTEGRGYCPHGRRPSVCCREPAY